jgi:hypothetical protein
MKEYRKSFQELEEEKQIDAEEQEDEDEEEKEDLVMMRREFIKY